MLEINFYINIFLYYWSLNINHNLLTLNICHLIHVDDPTSWDNAWLFHLAVQCFVVFVVVTITTYRGASKMLGVKDLFI